MEGQVDFIDTYELRDFSDILDGKNVQAKNSEWSSIFYVKEPVECFFIDFNKLRKFGKVPELTNSIFLFDLKNLMAISGKYLPIFDKNNPQNLLFSKEEYLEYRRKMSGIKSLNTGNFEFSDNLYFDGLKPYLDRIDENFKRVNEQRQPIIAEFRRVMTSIGLSVSIGCNSGGDVELVEAGSTQRGTNVPELDANAKYDFDFTVRIDPDKVWTVKNALEQGLKHGKSITQTSAYKVRLVDVTIPGLDKTLDLDFSLTPQKEHYLSSEDAISERLDNIREQSYDKYKLVLANIMYAKDYLKHSGSYKPSRGILDGDRQNGGIGGIGIENWVLQYGGSFIDASKDFLEHADGKEFMDFEQEYAILDCGKNHVSVSKRHFPYDNFVMNNMRYKGYNTMVEALKKFLNSMQIEQEKSSQMNI